MHAIHPVFHVSMHEPSTLNSVLNRIQPPPPPVIIDEEPEYEISEIINLNTQTHKLNTQLGL
jgi:hypothetical protein